MIIQINLLTANEAEEACRSISHALPDWFGQEAANERYAKGVRSCLALGALVDDGTCIGMLCLEFPYLHTANIYWMGIKPDYHSQGVGTRLLQVAEKKCQEKGCQSLTVETLSPTEQNPFYLKTYQFYQAHGFSPLFELKPYGPDYQMVYLHKTLSFPSLRWIDLTHTLSATIPTWDGGCGFVHETVIDYQDCSGDTQFLIQRFKCQAGIGTHLDAPAHCIPEGSTIESLPLNSLIAPCVVIDVSAHADQAYSLSVEDIQRFEAQWGSLPRQALIIVYTGWDRYWSDKEKYRNHHQFPSISKEAAEYLLTYDCVGIGIDTLSPDRPDSGFPVHQLVLNKGKYLVENIANAKQLPAVGSYALVLPMKIEGATEAPVRLVAMVAV